MSADLDPALDEADPEVLLAAADRRRDAGAWQAAARLYARVVALRPEAWPLMVQEGHCLKEAGFIAEALARYLAAEALAPEDADLQLQIGHAHKMLGQRPEAAQRYARAVALDPGNADAWREASATASWLDEPPAGQMLPDLLASMEERAPAQPEPPAAELPAPAPPSFVPEPAPAVAPPPVVAAAAPVVPPAAAPLPPQAPGQPVELPSLLDPEPAPSAVALPPLSDGPPLPAAAPAARAVPPPPEAPPAGPAAPRAAPWPAGAPALLAEATMPAPRPRQPPSILGDGVLRLLLDVSDVLVYFDGARTPTGIQRVQMGIVRRAMAEAAPAGTLLSLACYDPEALCWRPVDGAGFAALCALAATGSDPEEPGWLAARDALRGQVAAAAPIAFPPGAVLVNLGNSWGLAEYFRALQDMQRRYGLRYIPFLHDCVPLIVPEHCRATMVQDYARWFGGMALHAHGLLANSRNTLRDVRQQLEALLPGLDLPGEVVRLDADPRELASPAEAGSLEALRVLRHGESFALFVATIESRKNHLLVFSTWLQLLRQHGPARVPRLICVGKPGWHAEAALTLLRNAPELQRHVVLLPHVSDQELDALYERCAFTVYNSHYEGWGLPITEALAHGKVVVTPRHSALTEAGGEAALYFTPQSQPDLQQMLERVIFDTGFRESQEAVIRDKGRPRSWSAVKDQVLTAVSRMAEQGDHALEDRTQLRLGQHYVTRRAMRSRPDLSMALADAAREGGGWHRLEEWGVWSREGVASLRLPLPPAAAGAPLRLYLELRPPGEACSVTLRCAAAGTTLSLVELPLAPGADRTVMLDLPALPEQAPLELEFDSGPGVAAEGLAGQAQCRIGLGLRGFMLCRLDDHAARLAFLELQSFLPAAQ